MVHHRHHREQEDGARKPGEMLGTEEMLGGGGRGSDGGRQTPVEMLGIGVGTHVELNVEDGCNRTDQLYEIK